MGAVARRFLLTTAAFTSLGACSEPGPVEVDVSPPTAADQLGCQALHGALPEDVADQRTRPVEPDTDWAAAWGDPAIVLTCGGPAPEGFDRTSTCTSVNGVDWFIPEGQLDAGEPVDLTMTTVNREPVVEVTLPAEYWPPATALADLSTVVRRSTDKTGSCV